MSCGCANQSNSPASHFVCSTDYSHRSIAPMIVNNVIAYDNEDFITDPPISTTIPDRSKKIGMIFNNKMYKITSSSGTNVKKQTKFNHAEKDTTNNNIVTNIPLANFGIFNKSKLRYKQNSQNTDTRYGKKFSQERYLMKKKRANFMCQNQKFIC
jgi:hypothetical protein|tara:strand:- start:346 stop:810 length:465 start_codon:yes stop_codon:yes gene_type:complete